VTLVSFVVFFIGMSAADAIDFPPHVTIVHPHTSRRGGQAWAELAGTRISLAERTGRPTTFGWGPRFLHSTGQYHKGGPPTGVYLQITGAPVEDLPIPDREFTFGEFIQAQATGDGKVLADRGRPVLRLHLTDRAGGSAQLKDVLLSTVAP